MTDMYIYMLFRYVAGTSICSSTEQDGRWGTGDSWGGFEI